MQLACCYIVCDIVLGYVCVLKLYKNSQIAAESIHESDSKVVTISILSIEIVKLSPISVEVTE